MSDKNPISKLKEKILSDPKIILEDPVLMDALVEAQSQLLGSNIIDLRGIAMTQLEKRLEKIQKCFFFVTSKIKTKTFTL